LAASTRDAGEHENQHRKTFALERVINVVGQLTLAGMLTSVLKHAAAGRSGPAGLSVAGVR
jgi:hypothetical protein